MSLSDYSDLEKDIDGAEEPKVLPPGTEVQFRIIAVRTGISDKNDCKWYQPVFDVPSEPMAIEFNDFIWDLDKAHLDSKQYERNLYKFKTFAAAISLDYSKPFDWETELIGKTGWAILGVKKDEEYGDKNTVKKYILKR